MPPERQAGPARSSFRGWRDVPLYNPSGPVNYDDVQGTQIGTYTPSLSSISNVAETEVFSATYFKYGNFVTVIWAFRARATAVGVEASFDFTMPFPTNFSGTTRMAGVAQTAHDVTQQAGLFAANSVTDRGTFRYKAGVDTLIVFYGQYSYSI